MKKRMNIIATILLSGIFLFAGCGCDSDSPELPGKTMVNTTMTTVSSESEGTTEDVINNDVEDKVCGPATPSSCGALQVVGTKLADSEGNPVQLKGISTHGLAWYPEYVNKDCFQQLREEWNVNVIRLAMYTAEYAGYCEGGDKEALKNLVKNGVEYATKNDMHVIIDWHILNDRNPNTYKEEAKVFFAEMSALYADYNNVIYEICNEPNGGTSWSEVKTYAEEVIAVIREKDADAVILVGTPNWCQYVGEAAADPITGYDNIMYTLHFYAATHTDWLRDDMKAAVEAGLPIFVSEYGVSDASGNGTIDTYQADLWVEAMDALQISYVAWNLSNKDESSSIISNSCTKTSGFSTEDLSAGGKWLYEMLTADGAVLQISSVDDNGNIAAGSEIQDIGFIVSGDAGLEVIN